MRGYGLIIEPDAVRAAQYSYQVERSHLRPTIARTAGEAHFQVRRLSAPELIIAQAVLPDSDGVSLLRKLREHVSPARAPAVLIFNSRAEHDAAARLMIPAGINVLLPQWHSMLSFQKAVGQLLASAHPSNSDVAIEFSDAPYPTLRLGAGEPLLEQLASLQLPSKALLDDELEEVAAGLARIFNTPIAMLWLETERRTQFKLHLDPLFPATSSVRAPGLWASLRSLLRDGPLQVSDVTHNVSLARSPLIGVGALGCFAGAPLKMPNGRNVGAIAIVDSQVGGIAPQVVRPLAAWAERLSSGLLALPAKPSPPRKLVRSTAKSVSGQAALESLANWLDSALLVSDGSGMVCFANRAFGELVGVDTPVIGLPRTEVLTALCTAGGADEIVVNAMIDGGAGPPARDEFVLVKPKRRVLRWQSKEIEFGSCLGRVDQLDDFTVQIDREMVREELVRIDAWTGLMNRVGAREALGREIARSLRTGDPFSVALFQLDDLEQHDGSTAQQLIRSVAWVLRATLRGYDFAVRFDSERLLAVLPAANAENARSFCQRFQREIRSMAMPDLPRVTISAGVAQFDAGRNGEDLYNLAADGLAEARRQGDTVLAWSP